jgi:chromosome transmission fidelity protein 4
MRDNLVLELSSQEVSSRELEMDKELIKLLQGAIKDRQLQRANDLIRLLHHINSLDTANKLAEYYHLIGLQEKIKSWKEWREENDDPSEDRNQRRSWARGVQPLPPSESMVGHILGNKGNGGRPQDFHASSIIPRRSLTNAIPNYGKNAFQKKTETASPFGRDRHYEEERSQTDNYLNSSIPESSYDDDVQAHDNYTQSPPPEGKRKRDTYDVDGEEATGVAKKPRTTTQRTSETVSSGSSSNRKSIMAVPANAKPNPFARPLTHHQSIVKSNSFFDKVDAAEAAGTGKKGRNPYYIFCFIGSSLQCRER